MIILMVPFSLCSILELQLSVFSLLVRQKSTVLIENISLLITTFFTPPSLLLFLLYFTITTSSVVFLLQFFFFFFFTGPLFLRFAVGAFFLGFVLCVPFKCVMRFSELLLCAFFLFFFCSVLLSFLVGSVWRRALEYLQQNHCLCIC